MLNDAYSERGYHNLQHIGDMLSMLRRYLCITTGTFDAKNHRDIMFAILWHDIIMEADDKESAETKSAKSLLRIASDWNETVHSSINIDEVVDMIKATEIGVKAKTEKQKLIADLDKAVLGTSFMPWWIRYTEGIRMEYFEISDKEYLEGRIKFLQKMYDT
jgi:predicted metal-dependent HD superfamily phosphohydrolase